MRFRFSRGFLPAAALFGALTMASNGARADAYAEVVLTHFTVGIDDEVLFDFDSDEGVTALARAGDPVPFQANWDNIRLFESRRLEVGETFYVDVSYRITLRDDGGRSEAPGFWAPTSAVSEGFASRNAGAFGMVLANGNDRGVMLLGIDRTVGHVAHDTGDDLVPDALTFSGIVRGTYSVVNSLGPEEYRIAHIPIFVVAYAQTAPVPEPATWGLVMGGLALLGAASRTRGGRGRHHFPDR